MNHQERRSGLDRRAKKRPLFSKYMFKGRRGTPRRKADRCKIQVVERYSAKVGAIVLFIIGLSLLDAAFTLILVQRGAEELNPLLAFFLRKGPLHFVCVKYVLTWISVAAVLFIKDAYIFKTRTKARVLFYVLMIPFFLVIPWQLALILRGM